MEYKYLRVVNMEKKENPKEKTLNPKEKPQRNTLRREGRRGEGEGARGPLLTLAVPICFVCFTVFF
jgi:hypothetical protein